MLVTLICLSCVAICCLAWVIQSRKKKNKKYDKDDKPFTEDIEVIFEEDNKIDTDWLAFESYEEKLERVFLKKAPVSAILELNKLEQAQKAIANKAKRLKEYYYIKETEGEKEALKHLEYLADARKMLGSCLEEIKQHA